MSKQVVIIGGGIIGLCSAYYLQKEGHQVTVVDQSNMDGGASYVNAGYISPSHIIPLSAPGVMKQGLKWMFDASSPLYIKPRLNLDFLRWVWAFNKSCNWAHVKKSIPNIKDITLLSQQLYEAIHQDEGFSSHYEKKGLLMLCQSEMMFQHEIEMAQIAKQEGLDVVTLTPEQIKDLEPKVTMNVRGATYYKCDSHGTPHEFMEAMKVYLKGKGVVFFPNESVIDLEINKAKVKSIQTNKRILKADEFVMAAGSWTSMLSKKIGLKLLLQAGKGYRINTIKETNITIPAILAEAKVAVTPMNGFTRFAGTMEIAGINHHIKNERVEAIAKAVAKYYPEMILTPEEKHQAACGLRPLSPDGLPYLGKSSTCLNVTIATGHAMMGWSMGPASGKLISEIISNKKPSIQMDPFHPDRSF